MNDQPTLYRLSDYSPIVKGTLRERFYTVASLLWARGLPPPTADEIADDMVKVFVAVESKPQHPIWWCDVHNVEARRVRTNDDRIVCWFAWEGIANGDKTIAEACRVDWSNKSYMLVGVPK